MNIRYATITDLDAIAFLFDQYRVFYQQATDIKNAALFLKERIEKNESVILVAEENNRPVGFTQLYPIFSSVSMRRAWLLNDLFVIKEYRGKGIAGALLDAAKEHARCTGAKWLLLQTGQENISAQRLYQKQGWQKESDFFYRLDV